MDCVLLLRVEFSVFEVGSLSCLDVSTLFLEVLPEGGSLEEDVVVGASEVDEGGLLCESCGKSDKEVLGKAG